MKRAAILALLVLSVNASAQVSKDATGYNQVNPNFDEPEAWQEAQDIQLPPYPGDDTLIEVYVSPVATNQYFIDGASLAPGKDGVVRYVLVVKTAGGATNVSFEGIRCAERSWKHYASGRSDKSWIQSRAARQEWRQIEFKSQNPIHVILSRTLFCPLGSAITTADEGRNALRQGKHPSVN